MASSQPKPQQQQQPQQQKQQRQTQERQAAASILVSPASASVPAGNGGPLNPGPQAAGAAGDAKAKRVRTSRPKVKTGCNNCKQRRIKCDEKRPACSQCVRSKKTCTGYPPPPRSVRPFEEIRIAPKPQPVLLAAAPTGGEGGGGGGGGSMSTTGPPLISPSFPARPLLQSQQPHLQPHSRQQPQQQQQLLQHQQQQGQEQQNQKQQQKQQQRLQQRRIHEHHALTPRRVQKLYQRRGGTPPYTPTNAALPVFFYHPSVGLPFDHNEGLYFQLFRMQTANELSGFFDNVFWSRSVLIECHAEPAIRHAVVALGALYKTLEKTTESPPGSPAEHGRDDPVDSAYSHWEVALKQYSSACHALAAVCTQDERTQRTRLMASVLLACFDSFIGDHKQAIVQIQTGLALLERLRAERRRDRGPHAAGEPVEDELTQMFTRLAIQAKSYDMAFHFPQPYVIQLLPPSASVLAAEPTAADPSSPASPPASSDVGSPVSTHQEPIPERFSSLREARLAWDTLCEHIFRFMELMFQYANGPPNLLPTSMKRFGAEFRTRFEMWSHAFDPLLAGRTNPGISSQEKAGIAVLKMSQIMGLILYLMTFNDSEMKFDAFRPHFKAIVDLASEVVGDEERRAAAIRCPDPSQCMHHYHHHHHHHQHHHHHHHYTTATVESAGGFAHYRAGHVKASFSADLGIVPPLYVVATKSRDRVIRRQAIQLLRSSARREGMWDSELTARIGMWVMEIEEEGLDDINGNGEDAVFFLDPFSGRGSKTDNNASYATPATAHHNAPLTPHESPVFTAAFPRPSVSSSAEGQARSGSIDFGEMPLGPGGNARWDARRASQASLFHTASHAQQASFAPTTNLHPLYHMQDQQQQQQKQQQQQQYEQTVIPAEKRILVKACEFDLREHTATLKCGTRGLAANAPDAKTRVTHIRW
ncbi:Zn(2)-C6 fungal-type DNA-binding domain protein [Niveomyces insectorum RCEF 264]|uniref:Zn(2)-C6 fungal-type DNA-binding domain protein n=1 Tax=Niveomyces insectorum RCEF 264 TaxID=1081102 RepID=A0A167TZQ0_9HYPO|nr:Zn(2)-C6 fungal-type DNA-binding domain protein [Niveomyces insectorum RCEF 264]